LLLEENVSVDVFFSTTVNVVPLNVIVAEADRL
jgi:hypothetical protein